MIHGKFLILFSALFIRFIRQVKRTFLAASAEIQRANTDKEK
tara:strand:- start:48577 stop:48702 length:126 start_codon:yes stop_codon:yes gene_type:complete